ncbi:helix-turn-helix domain-containing protein [Tenacibaculum xiamenense]|uniref:helix-turn-helix domain-containing protein n=1 Tax=Tenacibaculum xiamenense TaxID=1261553 RepID=UPI00389311DC
MGFKLYSDDIQEIVFESGQYTHSIDSVGTQELEMSYDFKVANGWFKEIILDNFRINITNSNLVEKTNLFFEFTDETVEMHFTLQGSFTTSVNAIKKEYAANSNTHNIFYCNDIKGNIEWSGSEMYVFEINLLPSFFEKYLPEDSFFENFRKAIKNKETSYLNNQNYPITSNMRFIIHEIINCKWKGKYRQIFLESKVLELLLLQVDQIKTLNHRFSSFKTPKVLIDKMHYAKELISKRINDPMSLAQLAREINTNECTLKKEFKNVFGTTVFGYINDTRMEEAKQMLLNEELSIKEISENIGYKNPQHFSTAFKKKFGISPSLLKS